MTILAIDGFDMYNGVGANTGLSAKWSNAGVSMATGRFSGQGVQITMGASQSQMVRNLPSATTNFSVGCAMFVTAMEGAALGMFCSVEVSGTSQVGYRVNTSGGIDVYRLTSSIAGTLLGSSANGVIIASTWQFIEFSGTIDAAAGVITVKVGGTTVLSLTGQNTKNATSATIDSVRFGAGGNGQSGTFIVDDFYATDSATSLGERRVETLHPTADSSVTFTPNSGTTNFSRVNETLVDGDTSYVSTSTVGNRDLYTIGSLSSTPATIDAVQVSSFAEKTDATTRTLYNSIRSSATDSDGSAFTLAASYGKFERIIANDPNGGGAWGASGVNNLLIGPKLAA